MNLGGFKMNLGQARYMVKCVSRFGEESNPDRRERIYRSQACWNSLAQPPLWIDGFALDFYDWEIRDGRVVLKSEHADFQPSIHFATPPRTFSVATKRTGPSSQSVEIKDLTLEQIVEYFNYIGD